MQNELILAPLTRGGNVPFRRLCAEFGANVTMSEMAYARYVCMHVCRTPTNYPSICIAIGSSTALSNFLTLTSFPIHTHIHTYIRTGTCSRAGAPLGRGRRPSADRAPTTHPSLGSRYVL